MRCAIKFINVTRMIYIIVSDFTWSDLVENRPVARIFYGEVRSNPVTDKMRAKRF